MAIASVFPEKYWKKLKRFQGKIDLERFSLEDYYVIRRNRSIKKNSQFCYLECQTETTKSEWLPLDDIGFVAVFFDGDLDDARCLISEISCLSLKPQGLTGVEVVSLGSLGVSKDFAFFDPIKQ